MRRLSQVPSQPSCEFAFDEHRVRASWSDSAAAALLAGGHGVLSRSIKYHRPRSAFCLEGHCNGCTARIDGVPNLRLCQVRAHSVTAAHTQNAWSLGGFDLLSAADWVFAEGLDHHTLMTGTKVGNAVAARVVRQLSGVGQLPDMEATYAAPETIACDVCIVGGGAAAAGAAQELAQWQSGRIVILDDQVDAGGSLWTEPGLGAETAWQTIGATTRVYAATTALGAFVDQSERLIASAPNRLLHIDARQVLWATGGTSQLVPFGNNDRPGVLATRAIGRLLLQHRIVAGEQVVLIETQPTPPALVAALRDVGASVTAVSAAAVSHVDGTKWVERVVLRDGTTLECDVVGVTTPAAPASEGPRQFGCRVNFSEAAGGYAIAVDDEGHTNVPRHWAAGDVCGYMGPVAAERHGRHVARALLTTLRQS